MPAGDVRTNRSRGRGYGGGGGGSSYDDQGRGDSKNVWEWFERNFTADPTLRWLLSHDDKTYYWMLKNSVERYGLVDIAYMWEPGWKQHQDTRAHRLVISKLSEADWLKFHKALVDAYKRHKAKLEEEQKERWNRMRGEQALEQARREAARAIVRREDYEQIQQTVAPTVGMFEAEFNTAFRYVDRVADAGDWIENAVDTYIDGTGYGYEDQKATGVKLQITVSLDLSNSMYYNGVHIVASETFRNLVLTLEEMKTNFPEDLFTAYFTFSLDWYDRAGRRVDQLVFNPTKKVDEYDTQALSVYTPSAIRGWAGYNGKGPFEGEDTWISPLFDAIEKWEVKESDPGALKLDIIITDAVLEHPIDIREADKIQERRDGSLQSVMLNFMPTSQWLGSTLPRRCFQMAVDKDNVAGLVRQVLYEFVSVKA